ncbi:hypothetical protein [Methylobacterium planeticum]|uniref:Uncharacterized protein n=1 Tax=Methylobacterium planeticum TaxID=2615211 RepID=A0A6N6MPI1_9HYPH|nr:hypothetical protein [Methylobacterium planeticum]KAB1072163.1 hypothetical protein F6X51_17210 [Methylobacterium planeticum]
MSTISSSTAQQLFSTQRPPPPPSGRNPVASAIGSEVSSGSISSADGTALTSALKSIDASLFGESTASTGGTSRSGGTSSGGRETRLDPSDMKDRIDGLIDDQVTSGSLTSAQADTLKQIFAQNAGGGPDDASEDRDAEPVGGVGGRGHRPHGPPPTDASSAGSATDASASGTDDLLTSFIQQLQATQSSASGYGASGSGSSGQTSAALLFDFQT